MHWHHMGTDEVLVALEASAEGLSSSQAAARQAEYGPNEIEERRARSPIVMFLDQFKDFMIIVLIAAAVVSGLLGEMGDTLAIVAIVILNAVVGFVQEYRAEKAIAALKMMASPEAVVLRDGAVTKLKARELVPGDVVLLEAGAVVPADLRLLQEAQLEVDESALTGESMPVEKDVRVLDEEDLPVGDRLNMAHKGTAVVRGRAKGVVVATGMLTELGRIAALLQEAEEVGTPLQKRLAAFGRNLGLVVLAICAIVFAVGLTRGEPPVSMFLVAVSLAVAAVPEALPAVVTISLALGARRMVKRDALIRKLPAVETLGSVTYICSDKTGTLTANRMAVEAVWVAGDAVAAGAFDPGGARVEGAEAATAAATRPMGAATAFLAALALCNDAHPDAEGGFVGDPTETALLGFATTYGFERGAVERALERVGEIPFDSDRKRMTTFHRWGEGYVSFTKGAVESVASRSVDVLGADGDVSPVDRERLSGAEEEMAAEGLRVLGVAMRRWGALPDPMEAEDIERDMTLVGLVGLFDPPKPEARQAVAECRSAGIIPVMITGDHPLTAATIARRLGIVEDGDGSMLTGRELGDLTLEEFERSVEYVRVYARVAPEQKLKIVQGLQDKGQFVAMTGDGVNDAPALRRADIGVAMGVTGTDVSKEAADMVLLDDDFATIVDAVREGRRIFDNILKFIKYTMTSNSGEVWTIFLAPFFGLPIPLLPIHILWINLATDGLPGLAFAAEPEDGDIMARPPRHPNESIFAGGMAAHMLWVGLLLGATCVFTQAWTIDSGPKTWQTMVFTVLCLGQLGHAFAIRSGRESLFKQGLMSNKPLLGAVALTFALQMAIIYVPVLNGVFKTAPLSPVELAQALALSCVVFIAVEIEKTVKRARAPRPTAAAS